MLIIITPANFERARKNGHGKIFMFGGSHAGYKRLIQGLITPNWTQRLSTSHVISWTFICRVAVAVQRATQQNKQNIRWAVHEHAVTIAS